MRRRKPGDIGIGVGLEKGSTWSDEAGEWGKGSNGEELRKPFSQRGFTGEI